MKQPVAYRFCACFCIPGWILLFSVTVFSQSASLHRLDSFFNQLSRHNKAMGSLAISKAGQLVYTKSFGYSRYSPTEKIISSDTALYKVGSISKIFTATLVFQLIEKGKITLTTTLAPFFPNLPGANLISVSHLLNHRSGIRNITTIDQKERARTESDMLALIGQKPLQFKPGSKSSYSNCNFLLLGYLLEKIYRLPFDAILSQQITQPLGLENTFFGLNSPRLRYTSKPYKFLVDWEVQPETDLSIPGASGGIISTPRDLLAFIEALFSHKLIGDQSLKQMLSVTNGYGFGFLAFEFHRKKAFGYTGGIDEYESLLAYFPGDSLAVAYCSNGHDYPTRSIVTGAMNIYFGKKYAIPDFTSYSSKTYSFRKYTGTYSSNELPIKLRISRQKETLIAIAGGFPVIHLSPISRHRFTSDEATLAIEFNPSNHSMKLKWKNRLYNFTRID